MFRFNTKTPAAFFTPNPREIVDFTGIPQRVKKVCDFFARFKYATFFVKLTLHGDSQCAGLYCFSLKALSQPARAVSISFCSASI